jgi:hypothetical protein
MDDQGEKNDKYDLNLLRGWQRSQLKLLKRFTKIENVSQYVMSNVSGSAVHSHELGGKITPLTRAGLIEKAGRDDDGTQLWKLNEDKVDKSSLEKFLDKLNIE